MAKKTEPHMSPKRPYLLRAFYQWIIDNDCTPYIVVDATQEGVTVPEQFIDNQGRIVLNISIDATRDLDLDSVEISFRTRFSGVEYQLLLPVPAVLAIYAAENNHGIIFEEEDFSDFVVGSGEGELHVKEMSEGKKPKRKLFSRKKNRGKKGESPHLEVIK
ncbi:MAG: ClpXP protease specificity-enhancing factor [Gammaproteobacteria bacterium]|nr:ClpXP protease specificity-enhancing factor [Gammaproteobacteria bacterium]